MNVFLSFLLRALATETAKKLAVLAASELAKRTDNHVDDKAVAIVADAVGVK